ncbi:hypothetical protein N9N67_12235 [Bacteriovoracaceae bacterium]|nr:hypothetical protein [Bacteriovoracaceae bacterium]
MSENYEELMKQVGDSVKAQFGNQKGIDAFFLYVLDGFAHRYIKDDKSSDAVIETLKPGVYQASTVTVSMKKALELVDESKKAELTDKIKKYIIEQKPTTIFQIKVDTTQLNENGKGKVIGYSIINWDFPIHANIDNGLMMEFTHEFEDWDDIRKNFPLFLEKVCETF